MENDTSEGKSNNETVSGNDGTNTNQRRRRRQERVLSK